MSYIGNAKTPLLLASNVRDDLIPNGSNIFELSQEVPGGEAVNVCVVRRRYLTDVLVENTDLIELSDYPGSSTKSQIVIQDNYLASAFSVVNATSANTLSSDFSDGDILTITYQDGTKVTGLKVESTSYNRDSLTIVLGDVLNEYVDVGTTIAKVERHFYGPWEILDPETQYEIISTSGFTNRKIEIKDLTPQEFDVLYVLHRGEGTYNFVPSPYSVGPEQLSPNLRNFAVDAQTYNTTGEKTLTLSQIAPAANTLIVTANGVVQVSTNEIKLQDSTIADENNPGTWTLNDAQGTTQTITLKDSLFEGATTTSVSIRVLHLSFSTISRRAAFVVGQDPKTIISGSVTENSLSQSAVTTEKIKDDSVIGTKILLRKQDSLRFKNSSTEVSILKLDQNNDDTQLLSNSAVQVKPGNSTYTFGETSIIPTTTNPAGISIGSSGSPFKNLFVSDTSTIGTLNVRSITVTENITIEGTIDNTDVSNLRDDVDKLTSEVSQIVKFLIPIGTIVPTATSTPPTSTKYGEWVLCDGRKLQRADYNELFNALGGETQRAAGWPWGACDEKEFAIPDMQRRAVVGKSSSDVLGASENEANPTLRTLTHTHTGAEHTHTLTHTHTVPGHKHNVVPTAVGSINIVVDSGAHDTEISHSHNQGSLSTNLTSLNHYHQVTHDHSGSTGANLGGDHSHTGRTGAGTGHQHNLDTVVRNVGQGGYTHRVLSGPGSSWSNIGIDAESSHTHNFTTDAAAITHHHNFYIPSQTNNTGGSLSLTAGLSNDLSHIHTFSVPSTSLDKTKSNSTGIHTHLASAFTGFVGPSTSSPNGNENITTTGQSVDKTSGANYNSETTPGQVNRTGSATLPHIVVNYMIKAK